MSIVKCHESHYVSVLDNPLLPQTEARDGFMQTGTPKMLCCKHGGSRVKLSLWPFCGRIPGPTDTIWASFES